MHLRKPHDLDVEELQDAAQRKLDGEVAQAGTSLRSEEGFRRQEYEALRSGRGGETTDLMVEIRDLANYGPELDGFLSNICLVRKLREPECYWDSRDCFLSRTLYPKSCFRLTRVRT